ncbi:NAD(P)H-binding protein [Acinetobacter soli]|uniref:NAD(P)H-binding protein n=1 Tax=Acinetobacter soli TaxID=487316 RepID=UPI002583FDCF|nr:NAD(P)H-binding protein [uncultured Acinetobacter sp.]
MHILFIGYGKTSQRVAKQLFMRGHQISAVSRHPKSADFADHMTQDIHTLDLSGCRPIDWVYVLLSPENSDPANYRRTYLESVQPIADALKHHPVQRVVVVSSTRVYGAQQSGEWVDDHTIPEPADEQAKYLLAMEQAWHQAYPQRSIVVRPSGIYGNSVARMCKLAQSTQTYPAVHYSNRIHIDDLAGFLAYLTTLDSFKPVYLVSDGQPYPLHEIIQWFQLQLHLPQLRLERTCLTGKRIMARDFIASGYELQSPDCFSVYRAQLDSTAPTAQD